MSEMKAYKIVDENKDMVEYRIEVRVSYFSSVYHHIPEEIIANEIIAGYLANQLRELVNSSTLAEHVEEVCKSSFQKAVCPKCLREIS